MSGRLRVFTRSDVRFWVVVIRVASFGVAFMGIACSDAPLCVARVAAGVLGLLRSFYLNPFGLSPGV